ncbi:MAG TPA: hypothetical protein VES20_23920 [Bryobacteraceae bacterium]|nr:hypothetical protein [Bryobacteraceae bacterium]
MANILSSTAGAVRALTEADFEELRWFNCPTISNAVESFGVRPREEGVTDSRICCILPPDRVVIGYACTAVIESAKPPGLPRAVSRTAYWRHTQSVAGPKLTVVQDLSESPGGA